MGRLSEPGNLAWRTFTAPSMNGWRVKARPIPMTKFPPRREHEAELSSLRGFGEGIGEPTEHLVTQTGCFFGRMDRIHEDGWRSLG